MSEASSTQQQLDIVAYLEMCDALTNVAVMAEIRGDTVVAMQNRIASKFETGKLPGVAILVMEPDDLIDKKENTIPIKRMVHKVSVLENTMLNRKQDGTGNTTSGTNASKLRDIVIQALIGRKVGTAALMWTGAPKTSAEGQVGYDVTFEVINDLPTEVRNGVRISASGLTVTIVGTGATGEALHYTNDGSAPKPGEVNTHTYTAPFTANSGQLIRCAATATGKAISNFYNLQIP